MRRGEVDRGYGGWIPTRAKVFLVLVSRGDEGPLNFLSQLNHPSLRTASARLPTSSET